jgi:tetratricopeptide (TPR) repeat protein
MTAMKSRAALAALLLAGTAFATAAHAQDDRQTSDSDGSRFARPSQSKASSAAPTLSSSVARPLTTAQTAIGQNKLPEALTAAKEALAAAKTDYEKMKSNQFIATILVKSNDMAGAAAAAEAAADAPEAAIPAEDKQTIYYTATALALNARHNDKVLKYAKALQATNPTDPRMLDVIGKALYVGGDPGATAYFQKQVDAAIAAGKAPPRDALQNLMSAQVRAKDEPAAEKTMILLVQYYNDPADWQQIIDVTFTTKGTRDIDFVMLGRLLLASGATVSKEDADLFGQTTQKMAIYGDSLQAQAKGATLQLDPARVAADKADVPKQIPMAASQNGLFNIKLAEALYGYGMYGEAESVARAAQAKGGIDNSEAVMLIGISQIQQGKYQDGIATLASVQGGGPVTPRVAELWTAYAKNKGGLNPK